MAEMGHQLLCPMSSTLRATSCTLHKHRSPNPLPPRAASERRRVAVRSAAASVNFAKGHHDRVVRQESSRNATSPAMTELRPQDTAMSDRANIGRRIAGVAAALGLLAVVVWMLTTFLPAGTTPMTRSGSIRCDCGSRAGLAPWQAPVWVRSAKNRNQLYIKLRTIHGCASRRRQPHEPKPHCHDSMLLPSSFSNSQ